MKRQDDVVAAGQPHNGCALRAAPVELRPVDELVRPNPDDPSGRSMMRRVPEVLDCWFESGSMPFAQVHYPFENKAWFDSHSPADFIVHQLSQTLGAPVVLENLAYEVVACEVPLALENELFTDWELRSRAAHRRAQRAATPAPDDWLEAWLSADRTAGEAVEAALASEAFPNEPAIARAVSMLSPVTIITLMPAPRQSSIASGTSGLTGSIIA